MVGKSLDQRLKDTEDRIQQLEARKQSLSQRLRQQERKDRTRRLIQVGAIMAQLGVDSPEKAQALNKVINANPKILAWLVQVLSTAITQETETDRPS